MPLPMSLVYQCEKLNAFNTNTVRIEPQGLNTASAGGSTITFNLPINDVINMKSFRVFSDVTLTGTCARLPDFHHLIQKVSVYAGSVLLNSGAQMWNVMYAAKQALVEKYADPLAHSEFVRSVQYLDGSAIAGTAPEVIPNALCWSNWETTFMGTCKPQYIFTGVLPEMRIVIETAPNAVLTSSASSVLSAAGFLTAAASPNATYSLSNMFANIEVMSFNDGSYEQMINTVLSEAPLEICYKNFHSYNDLHNGATTFSINSQSLDAIHFTFRASTYATQGAPVRVAGKKSSGAFVAGTSGGSPTVEIGLPSGTDVGGVYGCSSEGYTPKYLTFAAPSSNFKANIGINGYTYPLQMSSLPELFEVTKNSLHKPLRKDLTYNQYLTNYFVNTVRFAFPEDPSGRSVSGINTADTNMAGRIQTENATNVYCTVLGETTQLLRVGGNRVIDVIE